MKVLSHTNVFVILNLEFISRYEIYQNSNHVKYNYSVKFNISIYKDMNDLKKTAYFNEPLE